MSVDYFILNISVCFILSFIFTLSFVCLSRLLQVSLACFSYSCLVNCIMYIFFNSITNLYVFNSAVITKRVVSNDFLNFCVKYVAYIIRKHALFLSRSRKLEVCIFGSATGRMRVICIMEDWGNLLAHSRFS